VADGAPFQNFCRSAGSREDGNPRHPERCAKAIGYEGCLDQLQGTPGDDVSYLTLPFDYDQLRGFLARLYFSIGAAVDQPRRTLLVDRILAKIADLAWKPIGERITGAKRIFIVPDGLFNRVPFAALKTESGRYLGETEDLRIHAHVIHVNEGRAKGGPQQSLTVIAATGPDLPFGSREAELVAGHFPNVDRFLGDKATSVRLFEALQKPGGIVHLVSHAAQSYENDLFSPILLRDGPVYPFDLYAREIKSSLVVLSACQTGDTGIFYRGQTLSLAHAFLAVGARATIASYWPISDEVTAVFMDSFYALLKSGKSPDQAIAAAMAGMRAIAPDLRDWAAFYLMHR
jgi:CHAT domain-containing protein